MRTATLSFVAGEGQVRGGKWREEDPQPLGAPPQVAPRSLLLQDSGHCEAAPAAGGPSGSPGPLPSGQALLRALFRAVVRKALELGNQPQASVPSCPLLAQRHLCACSHSSWSPGGPHTCDLSLQGRSICDPSNGPGPRDGPPRGCPGFKMSLSPKGTRCLPTPSGRLMEGFGGSAASDAVGRRPQIFRISLSR